MSLHSANNALLNLTERRDNTVGLNLPANQVTNVPSGLRHEVIIIPSTSAPAFGSMFVLDVKERNIIVDNLTLQFNVSAIAGRTGDATNYPRFNPAFYWMSRIELLINSQVLNTHYPSEQFIINQFLSKDEDRTFVNTMSGNYSSGVHRRTLSSTAGSNYFVQLKTIFDVAHLPILTDAHQVQLRIYMNNLSDVVALSGGTGTATATINYVNLIAKIMS